MPAKFSYSPTQLKNIYKIVLRKFQNLAPGHLSGAMQHSQDEAQEDLSKIDVYSLKGSGEARVKFFVDLNKYPDARAQEYGSGTRKIGTRKRYKSPKEQSDGTILIKPKNKKFLAFLWETADRNALLGARISHLKKKKQEGELWTEGTIPSFAGFSGNDDRLLFNYVHHPGIRAANEGRGYLEPALRAASPEIAKKVSQDAADQVNKFVRRKFIGVSK